MAITKEINTELQQLATTIQFTGDKLYLGQGTIAITSAWYDKGTISSQLETKFLDIQKIDKFEDSMTLKILLSKLCEYVLLYKEQSITVNVPAEPIVEPIKEDEPLIEG